MRIGLSQRVLYHKERAHDSLEHGWYTFLKDHALFPIQNRLDQDFETLASNLDLLILTGGDDSAIRRVTELKIASAMLARNKPILGVCHGAFLLTDLMGGTLAQCEGHMDDEHAVKYKDKYIVVNSFHSNSILTIPPKAINLATDWGQRSEAWIDNNVGAVVWHPERMEKPFLPDEIMEFFK
jgi:gamma-glutamyl-gamma-aminobutyrate hydrolase PuuD